MVTFFMEKMRFLRDFFVPLYLYKSKIKHGKFLQITGCFLWPHGAGPDLFPSYLRACCLAQVQGLHGGIPRVGSVAHYQPSNVPPPRSRVHLPQSRRPDNKSLVLQNKSHLSNNKWLLFSIKRQLFVSTNFISYFQIILCFLENISRVRTGGMKMKNDTSRTYTREFQVFGGCCFASWAIRRARASISSGLRRTAR